MTKPDYTGYSNFAIWSDQRLVKYISRLPTVIACLARDDDERAQSARLRLEAMRAELRTRALPQEDLGGES